MTKSLIVVLFLSVPAVACPIGTLVYEGVCAADPRPAVVAVDYVKPSDEKPPHHPESAWQRGDVKADMSQSKMADDEKQDQEKIEAEKQGKKAAGIK